MIEMTASFDPDRASWVYDSGRAPGIASVASTTLTDGVTVLADAFDGRILSIVADAVDDRGGLDAVDAHALQSVVGSSALRSAGDGLQIDDLTAVTLGRLAVLDAAWRDRSLLSVASDAWAAESAALRAELLGSSRGATDPSPPVSIGAPVIDPAAVAEAQTMPYVLGLLADDGRVALDLGHVPAGVLDAADARVRFERADDRLVLQLSVRPDIYGAEVSALTAVVLHGDTVVAIAPLAARHGSNGRPAAVAELTVGGRRGLSDLELLVVDDVTDLPSAPLRRLRRAVYLGLGAARARRLGLRGLARSLAEFSDVHWRPVDHVSAWSTVPPLLPYAGEIADLAADHAVNTHE